MEPASIDAETIRGMLRDVELRHGVRILYACESGSRAWGFPSADSDYDVRFIYAHPTEWYLSIEPQRDVIDIALEGDLDMGGWDVRKSFVLLRKSNCPLIEWLSSPIVYEQHATAIAPLRNLAQRAFLPESACHHYLAMAAKKTESALNSEWPRLKAYFYALRATLCCRHIIETRQAPPMLLTDLLARDPCDASLHAQIRELLAIKRESVEDASVARISQLDNFLRAAQEDIRAQTPKNGPKLSAAEFDVAFRETLEIVNASKPSTD